MMGNKYIIQDKPATYEEWLVYLYLDELKNNGFIIDYIFQPESFGLFEGLKTKFYSLKKNKKNEEIKKYGSREFLLNPHVYTADFQVHWSNKSKYFTQNVNEKLNNDIFFITNNNISYLETKPSFDQNGKTQMFRSYIQPQIWEKHNIYVQIVKPFELFSKTFVPELAIKDLYYKVGNKKGQSKVKWKIQKLKHFLNEIKE